MHRLVVLLFSYACLMLPTWHVVTAQTYPFPSQPSSDPYFPARGTSTQPSPSRSGPTRERPYETAAQQVPQTPMMRGQLGHDTHFNRTQLYEPAQIVARVGDQPIMLGELLGQVNQVLAPYVGKVPDYELEKQRKALIQQLLKVTIDTKLVYLDFLREIPDRSNLPKVQENLLELFEEKQLDDLMAKANVNTPGELDVYLRQYGSSLAKTKNAFIEQVLASQMRRQKVNQTKEITHEAMLEEYRRNIHEYEIAAKVRWEQLMVRFDQFPNWEAAYRALAMMGNKVLGGAPLAEVARRSSHGFRAQDGGYHDWTTKGSLASEVLDQHLFELPVGYLSQIIEDSQGLHIVRVIERTEAGHVPFVEAQVKIKEKLREQKVQQEVEAYLARLRERTPVWTIFDEENRARTAETDGQFHPDATRRPH